MKELLVRLPKTTKVDWIVDTCFLYWVFLHQREKGFIEFCKNHAVGLSTFTIGEVLYHAHDVPHTFRERFRHAIKNGLALKQVVVPVHPGNPSEEVAYVHSIDPELLQLVPDHSDAVIAALAVKISANILTRDKHHLFTVELENYFQKKGIRVDNNLPE